MEKSVLLAFSGGMDSRAAARELLGAGYRVTALYLDMLGDREACRRAERAAEKTGIGFLCEQVRERFERHIIRYFIDEYMRGRTPAPCTLCNPLIKWHALCAAADRLGIRRIATGHYFRIVVRQGRHYAARAADRRKDQSYYLWGLDEKILSRALAPMGELFKSDLGPQAAGERESMGVCFLRGMRCADFLCERRPDIVPGPILGPDARRIGTHRGAPLYTVGQKRGLGLPPGWAVTAIDTAANTLFAAPAPPLLYRRLLLGGCRFADRDEVLSSDDLSVVIRGIGRNPAGFARAREHPSGVLLTLDDPAWAPAAGQPVVLYRGERVIGGGFLEKYF